jgi:hypothetical protein
VQQRIDMGRIRDYFAEQQGLTVADVPKVVEP